MTEAWCYINGKKIRIPQADYEAREWGWHLGTELHYYHMADGERTAEILQWCRETFDIFTFRAFARGVYFLDESDAVLCKLRWD